MPYTIRDATYDGTDPDPVEWANQDIKPAILDVDDRLESLESQPVGPVRMNQGQWFIADVPQLQGTDFINLVSGQAEMCPFYVGQLGFEVDAVGVNIGTTDSGKVIRAGIYGVDADGNPGPLVQDAGTVGTDTSGEKTLTFTAITLPPGQYWLIQVSNTSVVTVRRTAGQSPTLHRYKPAGVGGSSFDQNGGGITIYSTGWTATSALPSTAILTGIGGRIGDMPYMSIRRA